MKVFGQSMSLFIEETIEDYNKDIFALESVFLEQAMEADETTSQSNQASKNLDDTTITKKLIEKVKEIIKSIHGLLARVAEKLKSMFQRFLQSDAGFRNNFIKARNENKPLEGVKLITYQYDDNALNQQIVSIHNSTLKIMNKLTTDYQQLKDSNNVELGDSISINTLLKDAGVPDEYNKDINQYFLYMRDTFHREKRETLFTASNTKAYWDIAAGIEGVQKYAEARRRQLEKMTNDMSTKLESFVKQTGNSDIKRNALKQLHNASHIFAFYSRVLQMYVQLKVEEALTYRIVLKKLYHFN